MNSDKSKKIFSEEYINLLTSVIDNIILHDNETQARDLFQALNYAVKKEEVELRDMDKLRNFYKKSLLTLQFLHLPLLSDNEVLNLIKHHFTHQFSINDYNLIKKIQKKLVFEIDLEERKNFKEKLRKNLLDNNEFIIISENKKTTNELLREYLVKLGDSGVSNKLAKAQYLVDLKKQISEQDYNKLVITFSVFDFLSNPSDDPFGYEEEPPIIIDGKLYVFRQGSLDPVNKIKALDMFKEVESNFDNSETQSDFDDILSDEVDQDALIKQVQDSQPQNEDKNQPDQQAEELKVFLDGLDVKASKNLLPQESYSLIELEKILPEYPVDSLEHRAIKQEINRLKRKK